MFFGFSFSVLVDFYSRLCEAPLRFVASTNNIHSKSLLVLSLTHCGDSESSFVRVCVFFYPCGLLNSPFSFKGGLWYISYRYHLFSRSNPHDGTVVAFCGIHQPQTGEGSPWKSPLQPRQTEERTQGKIIKAVCQHISHFSSQSPIQYFLGFFVFCFPCKVPCERNCTP